jgi:hypothetical protein
MQRIGERSPTIPELTGFSHSFLLSAPLSSLQVTMRVAIQQEFKESTVSPSPSRVCFLLSLLFAALPMVAADVLFPTPLHVTRRIHDSISGSTTTVEQYCYGNRVVTVRGPMTTIADYDKSEITEINRDTATYSVSRFDQIAKALHPKALAASSARASSDAKKSWELRPLARTAALSARSTDIFEADREDAAMKRHVRIGIDSSVALSKDALDVLTGSAFPGSPKDEDAAIANAARGRAARAGAYGLPVEQLFQFEAEGQKAEYRDVVLRVGAEAPPADAVAIPAGATLVESRLIQTTRMIDAIDRLPLDGLKQTP